MITDSRDLTHPTPYNKIIICGMYRSGSTLLFNIVKHLCKEFNVLNFSGKPLTTHKVHLDWTNNSVFRKWAYIEKSWDPNNLVIYSRRDVRDVICSYFQREKCSLENFQHAGKNYIDFLCWIVKNDWLIDAAAKSTSNIKILSYEKEINGDSNLMLLASKIISLFNVNQTLKHTDLTSFQFMSSKNKTDILSKMDGLTQYWPNHLNDGKIGKYKNILNNKQLSSIENDKTIKRWIKFFYS